MIVTALNYFRQSYDYVFTTGGIGSTHDDITASCVAEAFGVELEMNKQAEQILREYYPPDKINNARLRMALMPVGASLIHNSETGAPGFIMENVYVMAGVPAIMQVMMKHVAPSLRGGDRVISNSISFVKVFEGDIADTLEDIQLRHREVEIGSYPRFIPVKSVTLVLRSSSQNAIDACRSNIVDMLETLGAEFIEEPED